MASKKIQNFAVLGSLVCLLWGVRLVFVYTVGDYWFGTLGITGGLLGMITILSWKGKFGKYGKIYKEILYNKTVKKLRKISIGLSIFMLWMFIPFSVGLHASYDPQYNTKGFIAELKANDPDILSSAEQEQRVIQLMEDNPFNFVWMFLLVLLLLPVIAITNLPLWANIMGSVNMVSGGHLIHFVDIFLVSEIEALVLLVFVHWLAKKPQSKSDTTVT